MGIHEMYFADDYFKRLVDRYVNLHRTTYLGAFKSIEIQEAYKRHLQFICKEGRERL